MNVSLEGSYRTSHMEDPCPAGTLLPQTGRRVITGVLTGQPAARKHFPGVPGALLLSGRSVFRDGANACIHESVAARL